jgi:hypothetical protein
MDKTRAFATYAMIIEDGKAVREEALTPSATPFTQNAQYGFALALGSAEVLPPPQRSDCDPRAIPTRDGFHPAAVEIVFNGSTVCGASTRSCQRTP